MTILTRPGSGPRPAMTLLEVIISMAIFLMALGAIVPLIQMGQQRSMDVRLQAIALQMCKDKLDELMTGSELVGGSSSDTPFPPDYAPTDENWMWGMDANPGYNGINNLWQVNVRVYRVLDGGQKIQVQLSQLMIDPSIRGAPMLQPMPGTTSSSTTTTSGSTMGGG